MRLSIIAAVSRNGVIGLNNALPWYLPEDLKRFRALTMGHHIIMGRKTFESLGRLLPGRTSVIVTRNTAYAADGAKLAHSLDAALQLCEGDSQPFLIGGAQLYRQAIPLADRLYLTRIEEDYQGDAWFPPYTASEWLEISCQPGVSVSGLRYVFADYARAPA